MRFLTGTAFVFKNIRGYFTSDNPIQLVVAAFKDETTAKAALKELKKAQRAKLIKIENAAMLSIDETEDEITVEGVVGTFDEEKEGE
jgi:SOS-response transcriptional repressor LexA